MAQGKTKGRSGGRILTFFLLLIALRLWLLSDHAPPPYVDEERCLMYLDGHHNHDMAKIEVQQKEKHKSRKVKLSAPQLATPAQLKRFKDNEAVNRYTSAMTKLVHNGTLISSIDPILPENRNTAARLPFKPVVQYLGVLIDGGRHHFPVAWLKELIPFLHQLRFNMIHLRLTDDQAFNLQLQSYPELTKPSPWAQEKGKTYTAQELRDLVSFAKEYGIVIVPEINVPGHAGAWAGIPNMTVQCPVFICTKGYGIPLNIKHPKIETILTEIIREVLDIFDNPPFLHLGGDEVAMAKDCFKEAKVEPFEYKEFEQMVQGILKDIGYPEEQVIRWEETPQGQPNYDPNKPRPSYRAGAGEHFWHDRPGFRSDNNGVIVDYKAPSKPFFVSHKLYMDVNHDSGAPDTFAAALNNLQLDEGPSHFPTAVIAGTFELDPDMWMQRNVAGRLIAVAMGAAQLNFTGTQEILSFYNTTCHDTLGLNPIVCDLQGFTALPYDVFNNGWGKMWKKFRHDICERMTTLETAWTWKDLNIKRNAAFQEGHKYMWQTMKESLSRKPKSASTNDVTSTRDQTSSTKTGVILDLVNGMQHFNRTAFIIEEFLAPLELSMLQLRLVDNHAFAVELEHTSSTSFSVLENELPTSSDLSDLVKLANKFGILTYPEVSVSTNAGGWSYAGFAVRCPTSYCGSDAEGGDGNGAMAADIRREEFLPVVYATLRELYEIFSNETNTIPYLHLGSDERRSNQICFEESGMSNPPPYAEFEQRLTLMVQDMLGLPTEQIMRWENSEQVRYENRTGEITHYPSTEPFVVPKVRPDEPFVVTIDMLVQSSVYDVYRNTRKLMHLKPLAIYAELRRLDEETWEDLQVELRLTAFRMGTELAKDEIKDNNLFLEQLSVECQKAGFKKCKQGTGIESLSRRLSFEKDPLYYFGSTEARKEVCDLYTSSHTIRRMRQEMIGDSGDTISS